MQLDSRMQVNFNDKHHEEHGSVQKWSPFQAKQDIRENHDPASDFLQPKQLDFSAKPQDAFMAQFDSIANGPLEKLGDITNSSLGASDSVLQSELFNNVQVLDHLKAKS